jgi:hypothetical protein
VLISLCVALGLTAAAPQLDLPGVQRTVTTTTTNSVDEEALVSDVVSALEPSIAAAVANALRALQTSSVTTTAVSGSGAAAGVSSSSSSSSKSSSSLSAAAEKAAFEKEFAASRDTAEPTTRPEYNFEFKVADADEQTYITQQEARDGDELTGSYSYVDPTGALITVNYQAGPMGFSQTTDKQENFVQIVAKPPRLTASGAASASQSSSSSGSKFSSSSVGGGAASSFSSQQASNSAAASLDQSALIAQILAALQPQISASVNAALTASQSRSQQQSVIAVPAAAPLTVAARPVAAAARPAPAAAGGNLAAVFGDGYAVRIATPEFKIEY